MRVFILISLMVILLQYQLDVLPYMDSISFETAVLASLFCIAVLIDEIPRTLNNQISRYVNAILDQRGGGE